MAQAIPPKPPDIGMSQADEDAIFLTPTSPAQFITITDSNNPKHKVSRRCKKPGCKKNKKNNNATNPNSSGTSCTDTDEERSRKAPRPSETLSPQDTTAALLPPNPTPSPTQNYNEGRLYVAGDVGPYIVHVQRKEPEPNSGFSLHAIKLGSALKTNYVKGIKRDGVKQIGRNRVSVEFSSADSANQFVTHSVFTKSNKIFIPSFNVTRMGIVRNVPSDWSDEEVIDNIEVPEGCGKVIKVRRMNIKKHIDGQTQYVPSETMVITFDGQVRPQRIFMAYSSLPVLKYEFPTIQCFKCCRFGHVSEKCRSSERCFRCGEGHQGKNCPLPADKAKCISCNGNHDSTDRKCPEFERQKKIKFEMSERDISYMEASKIVPTARKSYASVAAQPQHSHPPRSQPSSLNSSTPVRPATTSFKKSFPIKPRSQPAASPGRGYDRSALEQVWTDFRIPQPENGCGLNHQSSPPTPSAVIQVLMTTLVKVLSSPNQIPSNVASSLLALLTPTLTSNGSANSGEGSAME